MSSKEFEDLRDNNVSPPELSDFISEKLLNYNDGNRRENYLKSFWDSTEFLPGKFGKELLEMIKNQINNPRQERDWNTYQRDYAKDIDALRILYQFQRQQVLFLKEGYGNALFRLAKKIIEASLNKRRDELQKRVAEAEEKQRVAEELKAQASSAATSPRTRGATLLKIKRENIGEFSESNSASPAASPAQVRKRRDSIFKKKEQFVETPEQKALNANQIALGAVELKLKQLDPHLEEIRLIVVGGKAPETIAKATFPNRRRSDTNIAPRTVHKTQSVEESNTRKRGATTVFTPAVRIVDSPEKSRDVSAPVVSPRQDRFKKSSEEESVSKKKQTIYSPEPSPGRAAEQCSQQASEDEVTDEDRSIEILSALASGDEEAMIRVQEKYYDKKESVQKAFSEFVQEYPKHLDSSPMIRKDSPELSNAFVAVFEHLITLQNENLNRKKMFGFYFFRKSADDKMKELVGMISYFLKPTTSLKLVKVRLDSALSSSGGYGLLENRGPLGAYFILSALKSEKNHLNRKYVNSTMERKLLDLQRVVANLYEVEYGNSYGM